MDRRPSRNTYSRRSSARNRKNNVTETTRLGNRLSAAVILCAFVLILAYTNGSAAESLRKKTVAVIGRNVIDEFEDNGNVRDNVAEFIRCMFSLQEDKGIDAEKKITEDIKSVSDSPPADDYTQEDTEPE